MNLKIKIFFEDISIYYQILKGNIIRYKAGLKRWFSYFKTIVTIYDFDYSGVIELEKKQLIRLRDCIQKLHDHLEWEEDVRKINLALKLLAIVEENGCAFSEGKLSFELIGDKVICPNKWIMPVYVNTSNAKRFVRNINKWGALEKDFLRTEKAWYLYNKIRFYYLRSWWT